MGDLRIGTTYPPKLGEIAKVYCGTELIWPHDAPNGNHIMLHIVYHNLYDLDVFELVKVIPRMKAWAPSSSYKELMTYYGYEKKTSGAIDFTVSVNCKKEADGTLSFKNIITYEDGTVVEQEHLSEVNKRQIENGESFGTHIDMYNWCESGSHYTADPVTVYMSTTVAWREFDSEEPGYRKEYTTRVVPISIKQGISSQGVIDSFEFFDGDHYVLWAYDGNVLRTWVTEGDDYIWEGEHGIEDGIGDPYCVWPGSALHNNMSLYGFFMGYFGEESTTTKVSIGYNEAVPLHSIVISAEEFTTMPVESTFWEDAGLDDYMKCQVIPEPSPVPLGTSYYVYLYTSTDRMLKEYHIVKDDTTGGYKFVAASDTFLKINANKRFNIKVLNSNDYSVLKVYPISFAEMQSMAHKANYDICEIDGLPRVRIMVDWDTRQLHMKGINNTTPYGDGIFKKFNADGFLDTADVEFYTPKAVVKKGVTIMVGTTWALPDEAPQSQSRGTECNVTVFDNLSLVAASTVAAHGIQVYQDSTDSQYFIIDCGATVTRPSIANPGVVYNYEYGSSTSTVSGAIKDKYKLKVPKTLFSEDYSSSKGRFTVNYKLA